MGELNYVLGIKLDAEFTVVSKPDMVPTSWSL